MSEDRQGGGAGADGADIGGLAAAIAEYAGRHDVSVAVAESLTAGRIAAALGAAPDSAQWFRGAVVAYASEVKHQVLGVPDVPVVSQTAAATMADGVRRLLGATAAVAVTGVGGPGGQDGQPPGLVWFGLCTGKKVHTEQRRLQGEPPEVVEQTVAAALRLLLDGLRSAAPEGGVRASDHAG